MKRPLVSLVIFYCLGIVLAKFMPFSFRAVTVAAIMVFVFSLLLRRTKYISALLIIILTLLAGAMSQKNSGVLPKNHINNFVYGSSTLYSLEGSIDSQPELKDSQQQFIFRARAIQKDKLKWSCCGKLLVKLEFSRKLNYGDRLTLIGNLTRPGNFTPAAQNYKDFLARQGIYLIMRINGPRQIIRQSGYCGSKLVSGSFWLRTKMQEVIRRNLADLPAGVLSAMVLGQKSGISWVVNNSFVRSGTVHILVVSGFNVGIVAFIANLLLKVLRFRRKARITLVMLGLLVYCLITGASNPVVRATVMGLVFLSAYLFKRAPDIYNSLAIAALFILIINPGQLFDIGFQLSFISVLAIVCLYPRLELIIRLQDCKNKICRFIYQGCLVSSCAWLGTLGIIAINFGIIAPVTVLANIFVVPLATLITLCGFTLVLSGLAYPGFAHLISAPTSMLINLLLNINAAMIKLPLAYFCL